MATTVGDRIDAVRGFNRFYTRHIGVLSRGYLDSPYSLTEVRVLFEISRSSDATASDICERLRLDAGYVSRLLAALEKEGVVRRRPAESDRRRRLLSLTAKGRRTFERLDEKQRAEVDRMLADLADDDQARLVGAMSAIERTLAPDSRPDARVRLRRPRSGDLGWVVERHGVLYTREYGWDMTFEGLVARIVADFACDHDPERERGWIAELGGERVGSIFATRASDEVAKLRLLLVEPSARGLGIGKRLVRACVRFARRAGYTSMTLFTSSGLNAARAIYAAEGFERTRTEAGERFGGPFESETWDLAL